MALKIKIGPTDNTEQPDMNEGDQKEAMNESHVAMIKEAIADLDGGDVEAAKAKLNELLPAEEAEVGEPQMEPKPSMRDQLKGKLGY